MSSVALNLQQSHDILKVLGSLKEKKNPKLCFSDTSICLDWDSSLCRTIVEDTEWVTSLFWKNKWNREMTSLPLLITKVVICLTKDVQPLEAELTIQTIRTAIEGLKSQKGKNGVIHPEIKKALDGLYQAKSALARMSTVRDLEKKLLKRDGRILELSQSNRDLLRALAQLQPNHPLVKHQKLRMESLSIEPRPRTTMSSGYVNITQNLNDDYLR